MGRVPLIGDLWRANSVLYQQVASQRTRDLYKQFTSPDPKTLSGCLFNLRSPYPRGVPESNAAPLAAFTSQNPSASDEAIAQLANYPTTFHRIDPDTAHQLIYRGWWLAGAILTAYAPDLVDEPPTYQCPIQNGR